jgi:hypothetical protein
MTTSGNSQGVTARDLFAGLQSHWRLLGVVLCTLTCSALLLAHVDGVNGPQYWQWAWRRLPGLRVYPLMLLAATPLFSGLALFGRRPDNPYLPISLAMLTMFALQLVGLGAQAQPFSLGQIAYFVQHDFITSYFSDAQTFTSLGSWMGSYPELMQGFHLHSMNKPPGPLLFYVPFIALAPNLEVAAQVGGIVVGVLATLSVPATYFLVRSAGVSMGAGVYSAAFFALLPGPLLFFPEFDQVYAALAAVTVGLWLVALEGGRTWAAVLFGVCLTTMTFFSYGLLSIGAFLAMATVYSVLRNRRENWPIVLRQSATGIMVVISFYLTIWLLWSFNPLLTFQTAMANQAWLLQWISRPYPQTILFDLTDFALGVGWLSLLLMGFFVLRKPTGPSTRLRWLTLFVLGQLLIISVGAVMPGETARVWIFLMPLTMIGVGAEFEHWKTGPRLAVLACALIITCVIRQNLVFLA